MVRVGRLRLTLTLEPVGDEEFAESPLAGLDKSGGTEVGAHDAGPETLNGFLSLGLTA